MEKRKDFRLLTLRNYSLPVEELRAQIYAVLGQKDEAFRWLEAAYEPPHHPYVPWFRHSPAFKPLHDDPRFGDLLRRLNLPE